MNYPIVINHSTTRYGYPRGTAGRDGIIPSGVCIGFVGQDIEHYVQESTMNLPDSVLRRQVVSRTPACHFLVGPDAQIIEMVDPRNVAWGVMDTNSPTFRYTATRQPNANYHLLYIGIAGLSLTQIARGALVNLIAKISKDYNFPIDLDHIVPRSWVNIDIESDPIDNDWIAGAYAVSMGTPVTLTVQQRITLLEDRLLMLEGN